jgi:septum site-determining protein MinC
MNKPADVLREREQSIEIRFGQVGLVQVRIRTTDPGAILDELTGRTATAPQFFDRTPICLDLAQLRHEPDLAELRTVIDTIRRAGMITVGLVQGGPGIEKLAHEVDLPVITHFRVPSAAVPVVQPAPVVQEVSPPTLMHNQPVRSGQRVYARNRDLVVTSTVGPGAEIMADGCVHIYGSMRGRAMAGAHGDTDARVFCQEFNAELVSIAGVFRVFETIPPEFAGKPVQAWLAGEQLHFARLGV